MRTAALPVGPGSALAGDWGTMTNDSNTINAANVSFRIASLLGAQSANLGASPNLSAVNITPRVTPNCVCRDDLAPPFLQVHGSFLAAVCCAVSASDFSVI